MKPRSNQNRQEPGELFEHLNKWATFALVNLLWVMLAIPIVTIPAATAGLFMVMSEWVRGKQPELFTEFFGAMRRLWLKSTLIALLDLAVCGLLVLNLSIFPLMDTSNPLTLLSRSVTLFVGLALGMINLYLWSLLVVLDLPLKQFVETSSRLALAHPVWSLGVLVAAALPVLISLLLPRGVFLFATFSCSIWIVNKGTWHIIRRFITEDQRKSLEAGA